MAYLEIRNQIITTPILEILDRIKSELTNGKLKTYRKQGDDIRVTCPNSEHKGGKEATPDCGIYVGEDQDKYGKFNCFACGAKGTFDHFVALCFDKPDDWAKEWLIQRFGEGEKSELVQLEPIVLNKTSKSKYLDDSILDSMQSWHPYMDKRKLSKEVCKEFKVKYEPKTESLVFPVYDDKGLWMLTRRSVKNKTFIIDKDKEKPVYLLSYIKKHNLKEAILVESQINCLTLWGWGYPSIATFGCKITPKQIEAINKSGINHLYVAYDPDEAGIDGTKKVIKALNKNIIVDIYELPDGKDVNDLSCEEFDKCKILDSEVWMRKYTK